MKAPIEMISYICWEDYMIESDDIQLEFYFTNPETMQTISAISYYQVEFHLKRHLLSREQVEFIVGEKIVKEYEHRQMELVDMMKDGDFGPGAQVCALIHKRVLAVLEQAELHFQLCARCGLI